MPSLLLDTNVWRYVVDARAEAELLGRCKRGVEIVVAPSVVYETLRLENRELRNRIIRFQAHARWRRLMPEAFHECQELLGEIRARRPDWLRDPPDAAAYKAHYADWVQTRGHKPPGSKLKKGFWERLREKPDILAEQTDNRSWNEAALEQSREARKHMLEQGDPKLTSLSDTYVPASALGMIAQSPIEAWRVSAWLSSTVHLSTEGNPYRDWLTPFVVGEPWLTDPNGWKHFWVGSVRRENVPSFWLRWAVEHLQSKKKVTAGTPCDCQLATYALHADTLISADERFVDILRQVLAYSPSKIAEPIQIPGGDHGVRELLRVCDRVERE